MIIGFNERHTFEFLNINLKHHITWRTWKTNRVSPTYLTWHNIRSLIMGYTFKNQGVAQTHIPKGSYSHGKCFTNPTPILVHFLSLSLSLPLCLHYAVCGSARAKERIESETYWGRNCNWENKEWEIRRGFGVVWERGLIMRGLRLKVLKERGFEVPCLRFRGLEEEGFKFVIWGWEAWKDTLNLSLR